MSPDAAGLPQVSVVLPAFNEALAIAHVVRDVRAAMDRTPYPYEIVVVDDGSTDGTALAAEAEGARVVRRPCRGGSGAARKLGIVASRGPIVVMLDADGSYDPSVLPEMLRYFPDYDQVNGARTREMGAARLLRIPAKWVLRQLACYLTRAAIPDLNTGLKACKRDLALRYLWVLPNGFSCVTSLTLAFLMNGHPVKYIPAVYRPRIGRSKFHPIRDTAAYLGTIIRMTIYFAPLRVLGPLAAVLFMAWGIKSYYSLTLTGSLQESDIILIMLAVLIAAVGIIADLIVAQRHR
ncbi:MAG: glycosyltransferase family 2 protein [Candidatus Omnitrophica bacterium]|nr:glycosyltransferase family 2 protein [Candidatus Omnitrophota bacterium]